MTRSRLLGLASAALTLASCDPSPCTKPLDQWCLHSEEQGGPVDRDVACDPPEVTPESLTPCGAYDVTTFTGGFSGHTHYFLDGEHVATNFVTDTNRYCDGFVFWYGRKIDCEPDTL